VAATAVKHNASMVAESRRPVATVLVAAGLTLVAGCGSSLDQKAGLTEKVKPVTLTLAEYDGNPSEQFVAAVDRLSDGSIHIQVEGAWRIGQLHFEAGMIRDVQAGRVDLAEVPVNGFDEVGVRSLDALVAPLLITSYGLEERVLRSSAARRVLEKVKSVGVEGIGFIPGDLRKPIGITRRLVAPGDFEGATIASRPSWAGNATFAAVGAVPSPSVPAHFTGYDGGELGVFSAQATGKPGNAKELTVNVSLWPRIWAIVANPQALERLSETQRATLRRAADEAIAAHLEHVRADELEAARALCSAGLPLVGASALELARWRRAVEPVWREIRDDPSAGRLFAEVAELAATARPTSADAVPTCPRT